MSANKAMREQASTMWKLYPQIILYKGNPSDYIQTMGTTYREARKRMAEMGYSDWIKYLISDDATVDM
jgi:hypothetical protein